MRAGTEVYLEQEGQKKGSGLIRRKKKETDDGGKQKKGQRYQAKKIMKLRKISRTDIRLRIWCLHSCHNESCE